MADPLTETIQRLVRESGVPPEDCRVHVDSYPDGWQVCLDTVVGGCRQFKSVIVKRDRVNPSVSADAEPPSLTLHKGRI